MSLKRIDKGRGGQLTDPCFCKSMSGCVYWTNGRQYTKDGTASGRVEVFYLAVGVLRMSYEWAGQLELASADEAEHIVERITEHLENNRKIALETYNNEMDHLVGRIEAWNNRGVDYMVMLLESEKQ